MHTKLRLHNVPSTCKFLSSLVDPLKIAYIYHKDKLLWLISFRTSHTTYSSVTARKTTKVDFIMPERIYNHTDLIPLYLGIAGHRDLRDEDKPWLKQIIKDIIEEEKTLCPNTPIVILTPLAEGADRLGAYAAIEFGIKAYIDKDIPEIHYSDNGAGINEKDLPHIFEPFYTSDQRKGTGLGLNIIYNLVKQKLHGTITCESEPGKGVLFKIEVPV